LLYACVYVQRPACDFLRQEISFMSRRPYLPGANLTDGGTIGQRAVIRVDDHEGAKQWAYEKMRAEFAQALLEAIERCRHPAVVRIHESEWMTDDACGEPMSGDRNQNYLPRYVTLEIKAELKPVDRMNYVMEPRITRISSVLPAVERVYNTDNWKTRLKFLFSGKLSDLEEV